MEKEFVPYEQALALKELGFDEPCLAKYQKLAEFANYQLQLLQKERNCNRLDTAISAPLYQQAFRWFREKHKIECYVNCYWNENDSSKRTYYANYNYGSDTFYTIDTEFETHEEAELECLKKLIEIVNEK